MQRKHLNPLSCAGDEKDPAALDSKPPAGKVIPHTIRNPGQVSVIWQEKHETVLTANLAEAHAWFEQNF